jgi:hypothetical protein
MKGVLARIDFETPRLYNGRTIWLLIVLSLLAYLVSPLNPMRREERQELLTLYPPLLFVYWFFFQVMMVSLNPHFSLHVGLSQAFAWQTNSYILLLAGAVFSKEIITWRGLDKSAYGGVFLGLYVVALAVCAMMSPVRAKT